MPIYEFHCESCNLTFEKIFSRITESKEEVCPDCKNVAKRIVSQVNFAIAQSKHIPKEIDIKVGSDAEKRWLEYEDRKHIKERIKQETSSAMLSRDLEGNYSPLNVTVEKQKVSEQDGLKLRNDVINQYSSLPKLNNDSD